MAEQVNETEIGGGGRTFRSTYWSTVLKAKDPSSPERREALQALIRTYWKPVYFFVRRRGNDVETSKDVVQGYFAALLDRNYLQYVDPGRGKFRTFLLTTLEHYMADEFDRARALKRGGGRAVFSLDFVRAESEIPADPASAEAPDRGFRRVWALEVMARAFESLRAEFDASGREAEFDALKRHLTWGAGPPDTYAGLARTLGMRETDVRNRIHRARARYRDAILDVIREYAQTEDEAQDELRDLLTAFSK